MVNGIKRFTYIGECVNILNHPKKLSQNGNVNLPNKYIISTVDSTD